jgi:hypothetical protein
VLILANHIGDLDVLRDAIVLAKRRMLDASQQQQQQQQGAHKGRPYVMSIP